MNAVYRPLLLSFSINILQPTPYRTRRNPLMEQVFPGRMVTAFVLDSMHTLDGGTCKDFLERITTPTTSRRRPGFITPAGLEVVHNRFPQLKATWIKDFARTLRYILIFIEVSTFIHHLP